MDVTVGVNDFVRRQVCGSGKSYVSKLTFEELAEHAVGQIKDKQYRGGYRDGVILVNVAQDLVGNFGCPFVRIDESSGLTARVVRRRPEEEPYIQLRAKSGNPAETGAVDLILYRHDVLAENDEQTTEADWELIAFQAIPEGVDYLPMGPVTMMRNQLELPGGTKAHYSSEEWAESVRFWQEYAAVEV